jgi:hypothetical protein
MRKLITAAVAVLAIGLWLMPISAAAQGRAAGRPEGAPGGFGHAPLGAPGADIDKGHGSAHDTTTNGPKDAAGKKAPDQLLSQNTKLSDHLNSLLSNMKVLDVNKMPLTAQEACANFKNLGQCVAAIHVANNHLGINFNELACTELGTKIASSPTSSLACPATVTNTSGMSLGAAIDALKPGTDGKTESQKAVTEANQDLKGS